MPRHTTIHSTRTLTCCLCTLLLSCYACRDKVIVPLVGNGHCRTYYVNAYAKPSAFVAKYEDEPLWCFAQDYTDKDEALALWWLGAQWIHLIDDTLSTEFLELAHAHGEYGKDIFYFYNPRDRLIVGIAALASMQVTGTKADDSQEDLSAHFTLSVRNEWKGEVTHNAQTSCFDARLTSLQREQLQWIVSTVGQKEYIRQGRAIQLWCKGELRPKLEAYKSLVLEVSLADGSKLTTPLLLQSEKPTE